MVPWNASEMNSCHISEIITDDETWIYQYDPETKCQSSVWVFPDVDRFVKVKRAKSVGKKVVLTFFAAGGHVQQYYLNIKGQWLHSGAPQLPSHRFFKNCEKSTQELDWGASCCTVTMPLHTQAIWQWIFWGGLLCSPDLAPCDFFLFPTVKAQLCGKWFSTHEDAIAAYQGEPSALDDSDWHQCFELWFRRMRRCIEGQGEYFEKM